MGIASLCEAFSRWDYFAPLSDPQLGDCLTLFGFPQCGSFKTIKATAFSRIKQKWKDRLQASLGGLIFFALLLWSLLLLFWRWGGDSNPRNPYEFGSLANCWFQPLTHLTWSLGLLLLNYRFRCKDCKDMNFFLWTKNCSEVLRASGCLLLWFCNVFTHFCIGLDIAEFVVIHYTHVAVTEGFCHC